MNRDQVKQVLTWAAVWLIGTLVVKSVVTVAVNAIL